ncbi:pyrroline-5-carboxylate reductase [Stylonychia lemnae]|uniref:Pyrroline-5-carboxylate reductase n=1 Tax=Stylonychia lemnae TaxID=5949 RepID=A0A078A3L6_STYLE|nr:pyrroline-5-carboxylate reductase [Stylonychia lemnae]|eukprot:CDW76407.1 pyrroline-5-carboxylate reductase [Stylonychia lemnae]
MKSQDKSQISAAERDLDRNNLHSQLKSPHFFSMSGIPKFGKNWLDNFIPDDEMQNVFLTSEVLLRYQQGLNATAQINLVGQQVSKSMENSQVLPSDRTYMQQQMMSSVATEIQPIKIGIIGCGQLGTMILTKFLETQSILIFLINLQIIGQFDGVRLYVSTRQPHLLRAFQQEFGVWVDFNNERVVAECDIIFLCILPFQAQQVLKDVRPIVVQRHLDAQKYRNMTKPLFVSCLAATGIPKLKIMVTEDTVFLKTQINVAMVKEDLFRSRGDVGKNHHNTQLRTESQFAHTQMIEDSKDEVPTYKKSNQYNYQLIKYLDEVFNDMSPQIMRDLDSQRKQRDSYPDQSFKKILSQKAFQFGAESGVTAEFIVKQASFQLAQKLDDLFMMFDTFQEALYSNDPNVNPNNQGEQAVYEESILLTILGQEYHRFISKETGEWENEKIVLTNFYQNYEDRIRYLFLAESQAYVPKN